MCPQKIFNISVNSDGVQRCQNLDLMSFVAFEKVGVKYAFECIAKSCPLRKVCNVTIEIDTVLTTAGLISLTSQLLSIASFTYASDLQKNCGGPPQK